MVSSRLTKVAALVAVAVMAAWWLGNSTAQFSWPASAYGQEPAADDHTGHDRGEKKPAATDDHDDHAGHDHEEKKPSATDDHDDHDDHGEKKPAATDDHDDHAGHDHGEKKPAATDDHDDHAGDDHGDEAGDEHGEDEPVRFSEAVLREFGIETSTAQPGALRVDLTMPGEVAANPSLVAHVVPRAPGIVRSVAREVGDAVKAGEVLAVLDSPVLSEAKTEYHRLLQELELNQADLERAETIGANTRQALELLKANPPLAELVKLEGLDLGAQRRELIGSYVTMAATRTTLDRKQKLHGQQIASEAELQEAESTHEQARADYLSARDAIGYENQRAMTAVQREVRLTQIRLSAAERHLHAFGLSEEEIATISTQHDVALSRLEVVAPIDGIVIERHLVRGEKVSGEEAAMVIADFSTVWVNLTVYQKDLPVIREGMEVSLTLTGSTVTAEGHIGLISPLVDEATRTATARVALANPDGHWRPGTFVSGQVAVSRTEAGLVVPRAAVVMVEGSPSVFVKTAEGFVPRPVRTGLSDGVGIEIVAGLEPGETYVSRNAFALKAELDKASFGHAGHAH